MKKNMILTLLAGFGLFLAGCATNPSYVGAWRCENVPAKMQKIGVTGIDVYIAETGGFSLSAKGSANGAVGTWKKNTSGGIDILIDGQDNGTGTFINGDTLLISGTDISMKFSRQ